MGWKEEIEVSGREERSKDLDANDRARRY